MCSHTHGRTQATVFSGYERSITAGLFEAIDSGRLERPDGLLVDFSTFAGANVAERYGIPYVLASTLPLGITLQFDGQGKVSQWERVFCNLNAATL